MPEDALYVNDGKRAVTGKSLANFDTSKEPFQLCSLDSIPYNPPCSSFLEKAERFLFLELAGMGAVLCVYPFLVYKGGYRFIRK